MERFLGLAPFSTFVLPLDRLHQVDHILESLVLLFFMYSKTTLVTIVTLAEFRSAVTYIKELVEDVNDGCFVLHSKDLKKVCHTPT